MFLSILFSSSSSRRCRCSRCTSSSIVVVVEVVVVGGCVEVFFVSVHSKIVVNKERGTSWTAFLIH